MATNASAIAGALSAIELQKDVIIVPRPFTIVLIVSTMEDAVTTIAAPRVIRPVAIAVIPTPANAQPAPNINIAAPSAIITGITGSRTTAAPANNARVTVIAKIPLAIPNRLISLNPSSTEAKSFIAMPTITSAPPRAIKSVPNLPANAAKPDIAPNIPTILSRPFPIPSQLIPLRSSITDANIFIATAITTIDAPILIMLVGINLVANDIAAKAPAIPAKPLPISSQLNPDRSFIAEANIFMAPAIAIRAIPVDIRFCCVLAEKSPFLDKLNAFPELPITLLNNDKTPSNAVIVLTPFPIPSQFI